MRISKFVGTLFVPIATWTSLGVAQTPASVVPARTDGDATAATSAVLGRRVTLHLTNVSLATALAALGERAGLRFSYIAEQLPAARTVTIHSDDLTVGDALAIVLQGTALEPVVRPGGRVVLQLKADAGLVLGEAQQGTGTISGYVRDSATGASIPQVAVRVDGTALEAKSGSDGQYKITGVSAGEYRVTVRRVGYIARTRTITLVDGQSSTLNFLLSPPATRLDEVVTTAIGEQRRYQVGNVISTINVDSIAPTVPAASVTDLISGRAPGVEVVETGGLVGSGEAIRIRGQSSLALQSDPIIIVDGIREDNSPGGSGYSGSIGWFEPGPSRLNDLDFSQIATIDILKGPAATTEYGTDAANGVIIITTKRGTSGAPQWHISAEQAASAIPIGFPEYYTSWGHATDGSDTPGICPLMVNEKNNGATTPMSTAGSCVVDSITHFNPLNHSAYSTFGTGPSSKYAVNVGGGSDALRYYVAGSMSNAIGGTHLPAVFDAEAAALGFPASELKPNSQDQRSLRANMVVRLGSTADMQVNVAYLSTDQDEPTQALLAGPVSGPSLPDSAYNYGYGLSANNPGSPLYTLGGDQTQQTDRFTGGMVVNWRPWSWVVTRAIVGIDHGSQQSEALELPQSASLIGYGPDAGEISLGNGTNDTYTLDLRGTATAALASTIRAATSLGVQLSDNRSAGLSDQATNLSAANFTFDGAPSYYNEYQVLNYNVTLGGYAEENLSFGDRLFVTGSFRVNAGSGFGSHYDAISYPGAQVSWIAVNRQVVTVRLRGALGESGQQPPYGSSLQQFDLVTTQGSGNTLNPITGYQLAYDGNLHLTPERSSEYEGGADVSLFANRLSVDVSGYSKTTYNALYDQPLGFDLSNLSYEENLGEIRNTGVEATVTAVIVQVPMLHWTVTLNTSVNANKLVSLAPAVITENAASNSSSQFFAPGYPLYGYWGSRQSYADVNRDGILEANEVTDDTALTYLGSSLPKQETSVQTYVGLWRDVVTIGALFDFRSDFLVYELAEDETDVVGGTGNYAQNVPVAPQWMQTQFYANSDPLIGGSAHYSSSFFENGSYVRFRELSLTCNLPRRWAHAIRATNLGLTGAVRNLALWTQFSGGDPEVGGSGNGINSTNSPGTGLPTVNNDLRASGLSAIPLTRSWTIRLNVGF